MDSNHERRAHDDIRRHGKLQTSNNRHWAGPLLSQCGAESSQKLQNPSSKLQKSSKPQAPKRQSWRRSKPPVSTCVGISARSMSPRLLEFGAWSFSGAWSLGLGAFWELAETPRKLCARFPGGAQVLRDFCCFQWQMTAFCSWHVICAALSGTERA
jgi:hypothetical protein